MSKLDDIFEQEFAVYYSDLDGQYHNGRQSDAIVPVDNAKKQIKALMLEIVKENPDDQEIYWGNGQDIINDRIMDL